MARLTLLLQYGKASAELRTGFRISESTVLSESLELGESKVGDRLSSWPQQRPSKHFPPRLATMGIFRIELTMAPLEATIGRSRCFLSGLPLEL
jgi:hypothetical protein